MIKALPKISIILAVRNESEYIVKTIRNLQELDYPEDRLAIICIDGKSEDNTLQELKKIQSVDNRIQILTNHKKNAAAGWNTGIVAADADYVLVMSGHARLSKNYLTVGIEKLLEDSTIAAVSGVTIPVGRDHFGNILATVYQSPFGVGNARYFLSDKEEKAKTVVFAIYRKKALIECGMFAEEIVRGQDWELNYRIRKLGYFLYLIPSIQSWYFVRSSSSNVWKRHFNAGKWKVKIIRKHPGSLLLRHLLPPLFTLSIVSCFLGMFFLTELILPFIIGAILYTAVSIWFIKKTKIDKQLQDYFTMLLLFMIVQLSYGSGFILGIIKDLIFWRR